MVEENSDNGEGSNSIQAGQVAHLTGTPTSIEIPGLTVGDMTGSHRRPFPLRQGAAVRRALVIVRGGVR